ncbi:MAG: zonular occludens toxin domain-containing protein [Metamycoplasmataceae bacterium]
MIWFYSGTPGSGKSLNSARAIYFNLFKYKRNVIANFPINMEVYDSKKNKGNFTYVSNLDISANYLIQYAKENHVPGVESQTLVVIDEASIIFNSRNWQDKGRMKWLELFAQHRKYGFNFIIISQFADQIDKQIRQQFEYEFVHRKWNNYGFMRMFPVKLFLVIEKSYQIKMKNTSNTFFYSKKYAKLYDTFYDFSEVEKTPTS